MSIQDKELMVSFEGNNERLPLLRVNTPETEPGRGTSWVGAAFLVVNAALGAGILEMPWSYNAAGGVLVSVIVQAVFLIFIILALFLLAYCSDIHKTTTYQDVVASVTGKKGQISCAVCITLYCFGTCITFFIIIGDQWDRIFAFAYGPDFCHHWYMNRSFTIPFTSLIFVLPLCFPRRIDFLTYASYLGVLGAMYVVALVTAKWCIMGTASTIKSSPDSWMDIFTVIPSICFAYQCHVSVIPIYSCLKNRNIKEFSKTISLAIFICVLSYTVAAVFGYWTFGSDVNPDILESYNSSEPEVLVAIIMIAAKTYTTYPILLFCGRAGLDCLLLEIQKKSPEEAEASERLRRIIETIVWFAGTLVLSIIIPNIADVIQLLGSFAAIFIFIFPGICLIQVTLPRLEATNTTHEKIWRFVLFSAGLFLVIGGFLVGLVTTQAIVNDSKSHSVSIKGACSN